MSTLAQQIDKLLAQAKNIDEMPNRGARRQMEKFRLTRKERQQSKARTNERIGMTTVYTTKIEVKKSDLHPRNKKVR